jgi:hypothetical protein
MSLHKLSLLCKYLDKNSNSVFIYLFISLSVIPYEFRLTEDIISEVKQNIEMYKKELLSLRLLQKTAIFLIE